MYQMEAEKVSRNVTADFTHGTISCRLTLEGEDLDPMLAIIDGLSAVASAQIHKSLIPILRNLVDQKGQESESGWNVEETARFTLLDYIITIDIELDLEDKEMKFPTQEEIGFLLVQTVAAAVVAESGQLLPAQLYLEAWQQFLLDNPDEPFGPDGAIDIHNFLKSAHGGFVVVGAG